MPLYRSQRQNVYHLCSICQTRQPLSRMEWQEGKLRCKSNDCIDKAIIGSRDLNVARQVSMERKELQPDQKLTNPVDRRNDLIEVLY